MSSTPSAKSQRTVQSVGSVSHCCDINRSWAFSLCCFLSLYCGAGSWSRLNSCRERERGSALASSSLSLPPSTVTSPALLLLCYWSLFQLDKCTLLQLQPHHPEKQQQQKKNTTWPAHPNSPEPPTLHAAGVRLWLNSPLPPMTPCTPTSTGRSPPPLLPQWSLFVLTIQMD